MSDIKSLLIMLQVMVVLRLKIINEICFIKIKKRMLYLLYFTCCILVERKQNGYFIVKREDKLSYNKEKFV